VSVSRFRICISLSPSLLRSRAVRAASAAHSVIQKMLQYCPEMLLSLLCRWHYPSLRYPTKGPTFSLYVPHVSTLKVLQYLDDTVCGRHTQIVLGWFRIGSTFKERIRKWRVLKMALTFVIRFYWRSARQHVSWACRSVMNFGFPQEAWSASNVSWSSGHYCVELSQQQCTC
jgi:hypothetical protein